MRQWGVSVGLAALVAAGPAAGQQPMLRVTGADSGRLAAALAPRTVAAIRILGDTPVIDGNLDDTVWAAAPVATDFVEGGPHPGVLPSVRTEFRVLFDDKAIYFGVRALDQHPSTMVAPYPRRDDETRSDWIFVEIDSRYDHRTGFGFGLNPRGVQVDATFDAFINYDYAWDGVWQGAARVDSTGWSAEYRIPFSQLAYAARPGDSLPFGLNVYRLAMRLGESSNWSPRLPIYADLQSHFNTISGLTAPESPERLEIVPYTAVKGSFTPAEGNPLIDPQQGDGFAGADLRLRIGRGFSATAAIHPDFGQVEADPSQINLTTFETYFTEQRPFFVEGASQFAFDLSLPFATRGNSFTNEQPFYSRRIGGAPQGAVPPDAQYSDIATSTTLLGAAKLSGRTTNGWSAGAMAAVTAGSEAQYIDALGGTQSAVVEPATLFDVVRLSRASHDGGSAIGLIGTGVFRPGMDSAMADQRLSRAFTLGVDGRHRFGAGDYEVSGFLAGSRIAGSENAVTGILNGPGHYFQRPDAPYLHGDKPRTAIGGLAAQARIAKIGGSWHWAAIGHLVTPGFEINDVGFQRNADWLLAMGSFGYQRYRPGHFIRRWAAGADQIGAGWDFAGERRAALASGYVNASLRNYWSGSLSLGHEFPALATDVLRGGPALLLPASTSVSGSIASDSRKPFQLTVSGAASSEPGSGSHAWDVAPGVTWRATDRLALALTPEFNHTIYGWQYVATTPTLQGPGVHYVLGRLDQSTASLTARADFAFSSRMTLQLYAQPFLSSGHYTEFKEVVAPRASQPADRIHPFAPDEIRYNAGGNDYAVDTDGDGTADIIFANPDFSQSSFNLNLVWRWEYRPGSAIYLVWTQRREVAGSEGSFNPGEDLRTLFGGPAANVVLLKVSYRIGL